MKKLTHRQQLRLIEGLCLTYASHCHLIIEEAEGSKVIEQIYKIAHLNLTCKNKHLDWLKESIELGKQFKKQGITDINR